MKKLVIFITLVIAVVFNSFAIEAKDTANTVTISGIVKNTRWYREYDYLKVLNIEDSLIVDSKIENNRFEVVGIPKGTYRLVFAERFGDYSDTIITINTDCCFDTLRVANYYGNISDHYIWQRQCRMKTPDYSDFYREIYIDYRKSVMELNKTLKKQISCLSEPKFGSESKSITECYDVFDSIDNVDTMLNHLKGVSLKPGYVLDVFYVTNWFGGVAYYYCRRSDKPKPIKNPPSKEFENILDYMNVEFTPEGIWSAFQLEVSGRYMLKFWHSYYGVSWQVFSVKDEIISPLSKYDIEDSTTWNNLSIFAPIKNKVEIIDSNNASITSYYWNEWEGLIEEKVHVERVGETVRFIHYKRDNPDSRTSYKVLVSYWCGIQF